MSIGNSGIAGSAAGSQLPQVAAQREQAVKSTADQTRQASSSERAEKTAGVGQTEQDQQASDRDADGRRLWERSGEPAADSESEPAADSNENHPGAPDPSGQRGNQLDISG